MLLSVLSSSESFSWTWYIKDPAKLLTLCTVFSQSVSMVASCRGFVTCGQAQCQSSTHSTLLNLSDAGLVVAQVHTFWMTNSHHQIKLWFRLNGKATSEVCLRIHKYQRNDLLCVVDIAICCNCTCICKIKWYCWNLSSFDTIITHLSILPWSMCNTCWAPIFERNMSELM